ncbi:MAG: site-specific integrase [Rhodospirillaceae bacterium]
MRSKLTKRGIDQLKATDKDQWVSDESLSGFYLRITPKDARTFWVQYRMGGRGSPTKKLKLGAYGVLTPDQARSQAELILADVARGIDPVAEAKAKLAAAFTVSDLADRYMIQHVQVKNKPSTQWEVGRLVDRIVKPELGAIAVADITRGEISNLHHRHRNTPRQANIILAVLSKMFSLAEVWGFRPDGSNPCRLIERYQETRRERHLSDEEMTRVGKALADASSSVLPGIIAAIRLLSATGCRLGEVLALRWEDVDLEVGAFYIRDPKNKTPRVHPIGAMVVAFISEMERSGPWLVHGEDPDRPLNPSSLDHAWSRIRGAAGIPDVRVHDLRHGVGTAAGATGANAFLIRDMLGHKTIAMTGRYVNRDADPLRELVGKVESRIMGALNAGAEKRMADVIPIGKTRKGKASRP